MKLKKGSQHRRFNWSDREERLLKRIFTEKKISKLLEAKKYGKDMIYAIVVDELKKYGYHRNVTQVKHKWQNLKRFRKTFFNTSNKTNEETVKSEDKSVDDDRSDIVYISTDTTTISKEYNNINETVDTITMDEDSQHAEVLSSNIDDKQNEQYFKMLDDTDGNILLILAEEEDKACVNNSSFTEENSEYTVHDLCKVDSSDTSAQVNEVLTQNQVNTEKECTTPIKAERLEENDTNDKPASEVDSNTDSIEEALNIFHDKLTATFDAMWDKQRKFWIEQSHTQRRWEQKMMRLQRKHDKEMIMMSNAALISAVKQLKSQQETTTSTNSNLEENIGDEGHSNSKNNP